jgi:PAS domain S-box-containing protein
LLGLFRDITARKQAEDALAESEEKYRMLVETSPDAVILSDLSARVIFASRRLAELYGSDDVDVFIGKTPLDFLPEEEHPRFLANLQRAVAEGYTRRTEYLFLRKDGTRIPAEVNGTIVRDASGVPTGFIVVLSDITERKEAEAAIQKEHRTLKHLLESSDHERQLIAYEIHDGLAQQLAGAIMQFQTYRHVKEARPKDAARAFDAGMTMLQQGHFEARRLISGVRPPILDESGVVAAIAHLVNEEQQQTQIRVEFHSNVAFGRLVPILENAIYRIVQEGLTNACKHSRTDRIHVELIQDGDELQVGIQDWGIGFNSATIADHCFGLEGIRERVRLLGGKAVVETAPGQGTCICVHLPLVAKE